MNKKCPPCGIDAANFPFKPPCGSFLTKTFPRSQPCDAMKSHLLATALLAATTFAAPAADSYESLRSEIQRCVKTGNSFLATKQDPKGYWGDPSMPALTGLALMSYMGNPALDRAKPLPDAVEKAYAWLLAQQKPDGGIYGEALATYNTAIGLTALLAAERKDFETAIVKARAFLVGQQWDLGEKGKTDNPNDGGIGYGSKNDHTDLSNTHLAIEAIALSKKLVDDNRHGKQPDLDWQAAITFVSRCQNLTKTNDQPWASDDPKNKGGFVYSSTESKAGEQKQPDGRTALRSYGSMSYAGLLSLVYAKLEADDPRVAAVKEWLGKNYSVAENPGLGDQGIYYYYHVMAKALTAANIGKLQLADGTAADWRKDLAGKILAAQREDGSWVNANSRWFENDPQLVTCYAILTLEQIDRSALKK